MKNSMLKFFKPIDKDQYVESASNSSNPAKRQCMEISDDDIIGDPGNRKPILMYPTNLQDELRRRYLVKGPCQPKAHVFPQTEISGVPRSFKANWFDMFPWLEYSVSKDAAFYLYCYLFARGNRHGAKAFTEIGFKNWKKATENFNSHVGGPGSPHNDALGRVQGYQNQRLNIDCVLSKSNKTIDIAYHTRVTTVVKAVRHLLRQGLPFRGHDESETSLNKGNFLELISYTCNENEEVNKVMNFNAPRNNQLTSHQIQKDVIKACATETVNVILNELDGKLFSILVDESRDCSVKEQMSVIVRFVSDHGEVLERFLGVVHVSDTSAQSLKRKIDDFFALNHLSLSSLRGQGYDGASNMKGHISGLKTLILNENKHAHYVHCFAHQLQLVVVTVAEHNRIVDDFFTYLSMIVNTSGASCKRKDTLRQAQHDKVVESLEKGEISTGKGKNQETSLARPGDTRWGSHYTTVSRLISMWSSVKGVLRVVYNDATKRKMRSCVWGLISRMLSYEFAFIAHFMKHILGMTNALSQYLQMKNQNITNAVRMIRMTKNTLQAYRENGWDELCKEVSEFCDANEIEVPNMEDIMIDRARQLLDGETRTYYRHFYEEIFAEIVDRLRGEFDSRFSESSTELLMCMSCLDPTNSFENFDHRQVFCLAELYEEDFSYCDLAQLKEELELFISEMKANELFSSLEDIGVLAKKMVEMKYHSLFPLTYRLIELVLILPVATASVERSFSAMKIVKTDLRNRMGDDFLTDCMVCYIEKRIFLGVEIETIVRQFQQMKSRRDKLPSIEHCSSSSKPNANKK